MTQPITNYTTYDQAYYYADLKRLPRLSEEDRRSLITRLPTADDPTHLKQPLMESYLPFAKHYAIELCPHSRYHRDLPDLIGIANLTLVEILSRTDLSQIGDLTSYLAAYLRGRLQEATTNDGLIPITPSVRSRARQRGEASRFEALDHLLSLDEQMEWFQTDDLEEPPAAALLSTQAAPERDPAQRAQVETWLSYLSPRAQAVLRLRSTASLTTMSAAIPLLRSCACWPSVARRCSASHGRRSFACGPSWRARPRWCSAVASSSSITRRCTTARAFPRSKKQP